jgi:hypothetical protein
VLGGNRKVVKFRETVKNTTFTPPILMKATPTAIASDSNDVSTVSVSKAGDVMMIHQAKRRKYLTLIVSYLTKTHLRARPQP